MRCLEGNIKTCTCICMCTVQEELRRLSKSRNHHDGEFMNKQPSDSAIDFRVINVHSPPVMRVSGALTYTS